MKQFFEDILYSLKISIYIFLSCFILGLIIGFFTNRTNYVEIIRWGTRFNEILGTVGMGIAAISFAKKDLMRPLDYEERWKLYFKKLNLAHVTLVVSLFMVIISFAIDSYL